MADTVSGPDQPQGTIGIIGLGIMGGAMAANLVRGGWRVIGYDIDATAREAARHRGVEVVDGPAALAVATSDIILSLPSGEAAIASAETIAAAAPSRAVVLEMSTLSLEDNMRSRARWPATVISPWTARCPAPAPRPKARTSSSTPVATAPTLSVWPRCSWGSGAGIQSGRLRQCDENEIRRQPAGCHS
jgi:hypothetical protein